MDATQKLLVKRQRDREWTRALGITPEELQREFGGTWLTPKEGKKWLERDRRRQVATVVDATRFKGRPRHY